MFSTVEPSLYASRFLKFMGDMFETVETNAESTIKDEKVTTTMTSSSSGPIVEISVEEKVVEETTEVSLEKDEKTKTKTEKKKKKEKK